MTDLFGTMRRASKMYGSKNLMEKWVSAWSISTRNQADESRQDVAMQEFNVPNPRNIA